MSIEHFDTQLKGRPFDVILTCNYSPWSRYKGGGQKSVHMLAMEMSMAGNCVCVVYSKAIWETIAVPDGLPYQIRWATFIGIRPGVSSPLRFFNGIPYYFKVASLSSTQTLLIGNGDEASLLSWVKNKRMFIYASRNTYDSFLNGINWKSKFGWLKVFLNEPRNAAVAMAMRTADRVTCTSNFSLAQLADCFGIPEHRSKVVPNGVDPTFLEKEFHEQGQKGVLFFGRLATNKGANLALEVFAKLNPEVRRAHPMKIIGDGPLAKPMKKFVRDAEMEKDVAFTGWLSPSDLAQAITSARVVFLPSLEESFGNAILETLVTGQKLITTKVCSIPEIAGSYAVLTTSGDVGEMVQALSKELETTREKETIHKQRIFFRDRFSWKASAQGYLNLIKN